jgi:hypothetical protein
VQPGARPLFEIPPKSAVSSSSESHSSRKSQRCSGGDRIPAPLLRLVGAPEMIAPSHSEGRRSEAPWGLLTADRPKMRLLDFKPLTKGALRGFARVELPSGLRISDIPVLVSNGKTWASLPSKPVLDADRKHKVDINNKRQYVPVLEWRDRDLATRFSDGVCALVRHAHSAALDGAGR